MLLFVDLCLTLYKTGIDDVDHDVVYLPPEVRDIIQRYVFEQITDDNIREAIRLWSTTKSAALMRYGHISSWDVSKVTNMSNLFEGHQTFNEDISAWDVSNVTNMSEMFCKAASFNQPLNEWNVSKVTNMKDFFIEAINFNQSLCDWDVSNVTDMSWMFAMTKTFD